MNPFMAPRTRNFFVKARVSIPSIPGIEFAQILAKERSALQLLTMGKFTNHEARGVGPPQTRSILSIYRNSDERIGHRDDLALYDGSVRISGSRSSTY